VTQRKAVDNFGFSSVLTIFGYEKSNAEWPQAVKCECSLDMANVSMNNITVSLDIQRGTTRLGNRLTRHVNRHSIHCLCSSDMVNVSRNIIKVSHDTLRCPLDIIGNSRDMDIGSKYMSAC
jgi:hypothetical protein